MPLPSRSTRPAPPKTKPGTADAQMGIAGFRIGDPIGVGPLGTVYRAQNEETGAVVVFRGFTRPQGADPASWMEAERQFSDLLTAHQRIPDHPNVQKILGFGIEDELFWIASERFEGVNLNTILEKHGAQSLLWARAVLAQIAAALDWAGQDGSCHTDLTPFNILIVTPDTELTQGVPLADIVKVKVINFGIAHARPKYGSAYAAPEQMDGFEGDRRSDVYSAGALLYAMLSGSAPFAGASPDDIARRVRAESPPPLVNRAPWLTQVMAAMLAKDPSRRYASVADAVSDLENSRGPASASIGAPFPTTSTPFASGIPAAPGRETPADRFNRLELDPPVASQSPAGRAPAKRAAGATAVFATAEEAYLATQASHIALQQYRLADQNLLEVRARLEQMREERSGMGRAGRRRSIRFAISSGAALVALLMLIHAAHVPDRYREATVIGKTGDAFVDREGKRAVVYVGDHIPLTGADGTTKWVFVTGSGGRLLLDLAGTRLHLREGSALALRQCDYRRGPIRRFDLQRGSVAGKIAPVYRPGAVFEIDCGDVRAIARGTLFSVARAQSAGASRNVVACDTGNVRVVRGDARASLTPGRQLVVKSGSKASDGALPETAGLDDSTKDSLERSREAIAGVPGSSSFEVDLSRTEEGTLLPVVETLRTLAHLPSYLADHSALLRAVASMQALCVLLRAVAATSGGPPGAIDPKTLKELGLNAENSAHILEQFQGRSITSYRRLPGNGYEILARANDAEHTLVRGRNGAATLVGNDDTDLPDADAPAATK